MEPNLCKCWIDIKGTSRFDVSWGSVYHKVLVCATTRDCILWKFVSNESMVDMILEILET